MSTSASRLLWLSLIAALAGCNLAPRYSAPSVEVPAAYKEIWKPARPGDEERRGDWWKAFGDPTLDDFETRLSSANQNVAAAAAAFLAARASVVLARAQYFPTLDVEPSATRSHLSATPFGISANNSFSEYQLPFDASWQPDFWGKTRNTVAENAFAAQASAADLENVRLSAQAELAVDYYELRAQDELIVLLDSAAAVGDNAVSLDRTLLKAGLVNDQTLAQAQSQAQTARAQAVNAGILRAQYEHAIAMLFGAPASSFSISTAPFRAPDVDIPAGVPSELLERRPDIAAAERAVAQANAQIGVARAAYFPNVTLSASGGFESFSASSWLDWASRFWTIGGTATETLFDFGARKAATTQAKALFQEAAANYRQTTLAAFQQTEDDLASARISIEDVLHQQAAVERGRANLDEEMARYQGGLDSGLNVSTAQSSLLALEQTALAYQIQRVTSDVQLIEALGGGWDRSSLPKPSALR